MVVKMARSEVTVGESVQKGKGVRKRREEGGKYARYSVEQVRVLEKAYSVCSNPTHFQRQQILRDHSALSGIDHKQLKVWFQNRRWRSFLVWIFIFPPVNSLMVVFLFSFHFPLHLCSFSWCDLSMFSIDLMILEHSVGFDDSDEKLKCQLALYFINSLMPWTVVDCFF